MAAALGQITTTTSIAFGSYNGAFLAFFCFLPMAFYFSAASAYEPRKQVTALEARVHTLEARDTRS